MDVVVALELVEAVLLELDERPLVLTTFLKPLDMKW
jgi:hypothetical protein